MDQFNEWWQDIQLKALLVGPRILLVIIVFFLLSLFLKAALAKLRAHMQTVIEKKQERPGETEKRLTTLFAIINRVAFFTIWGVALVVILGLLGVEIGPIIAAAGVLGLAVSFGAQSLVKDLISGMFILVENQIRIGDVAIINGTGGLVEEINLRTVVLRDVHGTVHVFPNGNISTLANMTREWSAAVLDIGVDYKEDPDHVITVMKRIGAELREDPELGPKITEEMEIMGLESFGDSAIIIRGRIKTVPINQWAVAREFRKRLKKAFDQEGISIPFPHRTLYFGEASEAFKVLLKDSKSEERVPGESN